MSNLPIASGDVRTARDSIHTILRDLMALDRHLGDSLRQSTLSRPEATDSVLDYTQVTRRIALLRENLAQVERSLDQ